MDYNKNITKEFEKDFNQLVKIVKRFKRTTYLPITKPNENEFSEKSKFGGLPYLRNSKDWPICQGCNSIMQFYLQLNLKEIPVNKSTGLIQLFYCNSFKSCFELQPYNPFSKATSCRKIEIKSKGTSTRIKFQADKIFDEKIVIGWDAKDDYPDLYELEENGVDFNFKRWDGLGYNYDRILAKKGIESVLAPKLFGWPFWLQSIKYPKDRRTGNNMEFLFQLDYLADGIGHIFQSPDNDNELAFSGDC